MGVLDQSITPSVPNMAEINSSVLGVLDSVTEEAVYVRTQLRQDTQHSGKSMIDDVLNKIARVTDQHMYIGQAVYAALETPDSSNSSPSGQSDPHTPAPTLTSMPKPTPTPTHPHRISQ